MSYVNGCCGNHAYQQSIYHGAIPCCHPVAYDAVTPVDGSCLHGSTLPWGPVPVERLSDRHNVSNLSAAPQQTTYQSNSPYVGPGTHHIVHRVARPLVAYDAITPVDGSCLHGSTLRWGSVPVERLLDRRNVSSLSAAPQRTTYPSSSRYVGPDTHHIADRVGRPCLQGGSSLLRPPGWHIVSNLMAHPRFKEALSTYSPRLGITMAERIERHVNTGSSRPYIQEGGSLMSSFLDACVEGWPGRHIVIGLKGDPFFLMVLKHVLPQSGKTLATELEERLNYAYKGDWDSFWA